MIWNRKIAAILKAWRANEIGMSTAVQRLVAHGWGVEQAWAFLGRY